MSRGFHPTKDDLLGIPSIEDVAIPLVIITLDLVVTPLVVSTIMKGKPFQFQLVRIRVHVLLVSNTIVVY